ncbi:DEKNAAC103270 [Brettanomyces naardenensis]|uniref:Glucosamine 6-phosphate N-acetyltransferase n=1 Tax=Brettanomyces naardenensis TaxID=13370 RepID=A0A448YMP7_BRENA|nr:DEKNAAC103270 [Brettanomyces naardenensis]
MTQSYAKSSLEIPALPEGYQIRRINADDYERGALETLKTLTTVGKISKEEFTELINTWDKNPEIYHTLLVLNPSGKVAAIGSIIVESKLIHKCGKVGHIEDIAVNRNEQGKKLGLTLIRRLINIGAEAGCYKVILDCDPANELFYVKCGLSRTGVEMQFRF